MSSNSLLPPIEVCLDSADSAIRATRSAIDIDMMVMIRPRGGDFCYTPLEVEAMCTDIEAAKSEGATGVVFGMLTPAGEVDQGLTRQLVKAAGEMQCTFHRAFDMTRDPMASLDTLVELGVHRVLSSGQEPSVLEGLDLLTELVRHAGERIIVMPGCGITPRNVNKIVAACRPKEIHVVGNDAVASPMTFRNERVFMGTELRSPEYSRTVTTASRVRAFRGDAG
jgi:copper homeostasis protein